jgi:hypothetical protein
MLPFGGIPLGSKANESASESGSEKESLEAWRS